MSKEEKELFNISIKKSGKVLDEHIPVIESIISKKQKALKYYYYDPTDIIVVRDRAVQLMIDIVNKSKKLHSDEDIYAFIKSKAKVRVADAWGSIIRDEVNLSKEEDKLTIKLYYIFDNIVDKIQTQYTYTNPQDREDCKNSAMEKLFTKYNKYNGDLDTSIFSFFTQVIKNDLRAAWNELNKNKCDYSTSNIFDEDM